MKKLPSIYGFKIKHKPLLLYTSRPASLQNRIGTHSIYNLKNLINNKLNLSNITKRHTNYSGSRI